jgi:hypothetical protein
VGFVEHLKFLAQPGVKQSIESWTPSKLDPEVAMLIMQTPWAKEYMAKYGEQPNLGRGDYDYQKAWEMGYRPVPAMDGSYHWPDATEEGQMLKSPNHPTAWMEPFMQKFGMDPEAAGLLGWGEDWGKK